MSGEGSGGPVRLCWGPGVSGGQAGGPGGGGDPALSPCETMRRTATGSPLPHGRPRTCWSPRPQRPPTPCPCPLFPDHSLLRTSSPCPRAGTHMCPSQWAPALAAFTSFLFVSFRLENLVFLRNRKMKYLK